MAENLPADKVSVTSSLANDKTADIVVRSLQQDSAIEVSCNRVKGDPLAVGTLSIKNGTLSWTWNAVQPGGLNLDAVEAYLHAARIDVFKGDNRAARLQFAPETSELRLDQAFPIRDLKASVVLSVSGFRDPWTVAEEAGDKVAIADGRQKLTFRLDSKARMIRAELLADDRSDLQKARNLIDSIRKDIAGLLAKRSQAMQQPDSPARANELLPIDNDLRDNRRKLADAEQQLRTLNQGARPTAAPACTVRARYDNGVVALELKFQNGKG